MTVSSHKQSTDNEASDSMDALIAQISAIKISPEKAALLTAAINARANLDQNAAPSNDDDNVSSVSALATVPSNANTLHVRHSVTADTGKTLLSGVTIVPGPVPPPAVAPGLHQVGGVVVPNGHYIATYNEVIFVLPYQGEIGPYYLITQGKLIGVVAQWQKASPFVIGVSGASFSKVSSVQQGWQRVEDAIDAGQTKYL